MHVLAKPSCSVGNADIALRMLLWPRCCGMHCLQNHDAMAAAMMPANIKTQAGTNFDIKKL